jgi:hypothetical protein
MDTLVLILNTTLSLYVCKYLIKYKQIFNKYIRPFLTWRFIICYLPLWFIFTGWTYVAIAVGPTWLRTIGTSWLAWMWMPWCPEKLITLPVAIWLHKKLFPNQSTKVLDDMLSKEKENIKKRKKVIQ